MEIKSGKLIAYTERAAVADRTGGAGANLEAICHGTSTEAVRTSTTVAILLGRALYRLHSETAEEAFIRIPFTQKRPTCEVQHMH